MSRWRLSAHAFRTILTKEILRFSRIWLQTVLPPMVTTALYFVIFGRLIGSRLGEMDGHPYIDFIVPGLILMSVISNSYANVVSSFYNAKFQRHVEELLISPVPNAVILGGYVAGGVVRGLVVGTAVTVVASFFTDFAVHSYAVTVAVFLLTSMLFATAGFVNAVFANSFDDISVIPTFVLTPLTYLGGVFYSVSLLPEVWQRVSFANPVLYMINAFRYGLLGVTDIDLGLAFGLIVAFIVALGGFALWLLDRGIGLKS
ncbi:MAG: ABC transporter permease [Gammaproteobacteria bacterium]|nr:ABC transporter permease [Gammaproteobacteria bacterium]